MSSAPPAVRFRRSYLEAQARRDLRSPAVRALALALWLVSTAVSTVLLVQAVNDLEWLRDYTMQVIVVSFAAANRNRFLYGFALPITASVLWLTALLVTAKYYEAYGLRTGWWGPWTAATPFRRLAPGSGATVLIGRFLFVLGVQGCAGLAILTVQAALWSVSATGLGRLVVAASICVAAAGAGFTAARLVRARIERAVAVRDAAFDRGAFVGRPPGVRRNRLVDR